jgi:predicted CXXCH cytochrome family protein
MNSFAFASSGLSMLYASSRPQPILLGLFLVFVTECPALGADTILGSKHDLSTTGPGPIRAANETEVCMFCHTPHRGTGQTPLWNHVLSSATYIPYSSSTIKATIGQPTGASKLCLSCHDGTIALGMISSQSTPIQMQGGTTTLPPGRSLIGTDLSDDHPISFRYDSGLASESGQLRDPIMLTSHVRLDDEAQLQCTSCHDPHNNRYGDFLVQDNFAGSLCITCHDMKDWQNSSHRLSPKTWNGAGIDPWPHTTYMTVAGNACYNCHAAHGAGTRERLLTFPLEEQNCNSCHSGNVATKDIQAEFNKMSVHPILNTDTVHDPIEDPVNPPRHVECADCHNPHASRLTTAVPPNASGALAGLVGVTGVGTPIRPLTKEYELCFRCHADSINRGSARVPRHFVQTNARLEFAPESQSFHPVQTVGKNPNVPSLLPPMTASTLMYCTDCHNNNQGPGAGGTGPNGPHGSVYTPILERELVLSDFNLENFGSYALCYKCHDRNSILSDQSFKGHRQHIVDARTACTTCHDPHGVQQNTHLINFNTLYARPASNGRFEFIDQGTFRGTCSVLCHDKDHAALSYGQ